MEEIEKKTLPEENDPALISAFEIAMLDWDKLSYEAYLKGGHLAGDAPCEHLKREGHWDAQWLMREYGRIASKLSRESSTIRSFVEYIGDCAFDAWAEAEEKARDRAGKADSEPSKEPQTV